MYEFNFTTFHVDFVLSHVLVSFTQPTEDSDVNTEWRGKKKVYVWGRI